VNHPANLQVSLEGLAEVRGMKVEDLADQLEQNFQRWFL
jgi:Tat protein secretion system quality control protein TatD with DNase activity